MPDDWVVDYYDGGFRVAYDGPFDVYPLGFEALEISFLSDLSTTEIGSSEDSITGIVFGPVVLENGFSQSVRLDDGSVATAPAGFLPFYFDMPAFDGPQLTAQNLIDLFGLTLDDIRPIASEIEFEDDEVRITLGNVVEGPTYMLQFREDLSNPTWVNLRTFSFRDLDETNSIIHDGEGLSGFFRVTML